MDIFYPSYGFRLLSSPLHNSIDSIRGLEQLSEPSKPLATSRETMQRTKGRTAGSANSRFPKLPPGRILTPLGCHAHGYHVTYQRPAIGCQLVLAQPRPHEPFLRPNLTNCLVSCSASKKHLGIYTCLYFLYIFLFVLLSVYPAIRHPRPAPGDSRHPGGVLSYHPSSRVVSQGGTWKRENV